MHQESVLVSFHNDFVFPSSEVHHLRLNLNLYRTMNFLIKGCQVLAAMLWLDLGYCLCIKGYATKENFDFMSISINKYQ